MPNPRKKDEEARIEELAQAMRLHGEGYTQTDALRHFPQEQVNRYWQAACDRANEAAERVDG